MNLRPAAILLALGPRRRHRLQRTGQGHRDSRCQRGPEPRRPHLDAERGTRQHLGTKPADPTAPKQGDVKITTKKKAAGLETCGVLRAADIEAATGGKSSADGGCIHTTTGPSAVITQMVMIPDVAEQEGEKKQIEIGGNTAWQVAASKEDCRVTVMLTDDPAVITPAFSVSVLAIDDLDTCATALKLATEGFNRIPNA